MPLTGIQNIDGENPICLDWIIPGLLYLVLVAALPQGPAVWARNLPSWYMKGNLAKQRYSACENKKF